MSSQKGGASMYLCEDVINSLERLAENPREDGSVAYKRYIFSKRNKNMGLDSGAFSGNQNFNIYRPLQVHVARIVPTRGRCPAKGKAETWPDPVLTEGISAASS